MTETADAIIIGGGAVGTSAAFHLASLGLKRVVLCERQTLASGATGKSAAFVQVMETSEPEARITLASLPYYFHWSDLVGVGSAGFNQTGFLRVCKADQLEQAERHVALLRGWGVDVEILDQQQVAALARISKPPTLRSASISRGPATHRPHLSRLASLSAPSSLARRCANRRR